MITLCNCIILNAYYVPDNIVSTVDILIYVILQLLKLVLLLYTFYRCED